MNPAILSILAFATFTHADLCPYPVPEIVLAEQPDNRLLIITENHDSAAQRNYVASLLPQLRQHGYDTLLIEAPPALAQDRSALRQNLQSAPGILKQPDQAIDAYLQLLDTADQHDFDIQGYDTDLPWPWSTNEPPPLRPFLKRYVLQRNEYIVRNLQKHFVQQPSAKAVMLIGHLHLGTRNNPGMVKIRAALGKKADYDLPSQIAQAIRKPVFAISLSGGDQSSDSPLHPYALQAIQQNAAHQWRFALTHGTHNADLFLHIPQPTTNYLAASHP